jgi:hypothetical protein
VSLRKVLAVGLTCAVCQLYSLETQCVHVADDKTFFIAVGNVCAMHRAYMHSVKVSTVEHWPAGWLAIENLQTVPCLLKKGRKRQYVMLLQPGSFTSKITPAEILSQGGIAGMKRCVVELQPGVTTSSKPPVTLTIARNAQDARHAKAR